MMRLSLAVSRCCSHRM